MSFRPKAIIALLTVCSLAIADAAAAQSEPEIAAARQALRRGDYLTAYDGFLAFRATHGGSLYVDFVLGVSACHLADHKSWGVQHLSAVRQQYGHAMHAEHLKVLDREIGACASGPGTLQPVDLRRYPQSLGPGVDIRASKPIAAGIDISAMKQRSADAMLQSGSLSNQLSTTSLQSNSDH